MSRTSYFLNTSLFLSGSVLGFIIFIFFLRIEKKIYLYAFKIIKVRKIKKNIILDENRITLAYDEKKN